MFQHMLNASYSTAFDRLANNVHQSSEAECIWKRSRSQHSVVGGDAFLPAGEHHILPAVTLCLSRVGLLVGTSSPTAHQKHTQRKVKRLKVSTFIYRHLQGNPDQQRFTTRSGILTGNDTSDAAQVATAHCPNERTSDPAVCSYNRPTYATASRTMAFTPQCSLATTHYT